MADINVNMQRLLQQLKELDVAPRQIEAIKRAFDGTTKGTEEFAAAVELAEAKIENARGAAEALNTPFASLQKILLENVAALDSQNSSVNKAKALQNKVLNISRELLYDNQGMVDLNKRQLESKLKTLETSREALELNRELAKSQLEALESSTKDIKNKAQKIRQLKEVVEFNAREDAGLKGIIEKTRVRLDLERAINQNMGVAGALVGGTGALMERLGMRSGIFHQAMEDANEEMREMAKNMGENVSFMNKLKIAAKGFSTLADGFGPALRDPTVIVGKIVTAFFDVNKAQTEFIQLTGQSAASLGGVNTEVAAMTDLLKTAASFTKQTGLNAAAIFTPQQIGQIADATELLGISAEQGVKLGMIMKQTGKSANDIGDAIYANVDAGIANKVVYDDVLSASDDIVASSGGNVEALGRAASAARKLGMDLTKVNQIADGLLDFETSIESELEAQLLTGKNINLSKARELALNNDLEGVAKELEKNGASAAEFAKMNRIQQQALAKAMGMSREELGKMVLTKEAMADMSADEIANARGMTLEQSKQMDIQAKIQKSMDRLAQAFAPILEAVVPIVEALLTIVRPIASAIGYLLKFKAVSIALTTVLAGIATLFAAKKIANFVGVGIKGFNAMSSSISGMGGGLEGLKGLFGKAGKSITDSFSKGLGDKTKVAFDKNVNRFRDQATGKFVSADKAKELGAKMPGKEIADTSKATKAVKPGKNIKTFLKNLAEGLKHMASMKVLYGALNLIPASIGLVAMIPGVIGAKLMELISGPKLLISMQSLAQGLTAMGTGKVLLGTLALLGASAAFILMIPASLGMLLLGAAAPIAAAGIYALIPALTALGTAMTTGVAALGLVALIGLAVGAGAAFALMGAGALMLGMGIKYAAEGISLIFSQFSGLVGMVPQLLSLVPALFGLAAGLVAVGVAGIIALPGLLALALGSGGLLALGGTFALIGAGAMMFGMGIKFAAEGLNSMVTQLIGLATVAPQLLLVGAGLMSIAAGLGMIAISGIAAIPALAALSAFALVASPLAALGGLFGDGGGEEDNSMAEISSKLDTLISVVSAGGNVYLDGDKVGEAQVLGTYKLS